MTALADELLRAWHEATLPDIVTAALAPIREPHQPYPCPCPAPLCAVEYCRECSMICPCPTIATCDEIEKTARDAR